MFGTSFGLAVVLLASTLEGLPPEAPRSGPVITIDVSTNQAYFFRDGELVKKSKAAPGGAVRPGRA